MARPQALVQRPRQRRSGFDSKNDTNYPINNNNSNNNKLTRSGMHETEIPPTAPTGQSADLLVILVNFVDVKIQHSEEVWADHVFGTTGSSVKSYFEEQSFGQFTLVPARETYGVENNGVVAVTIPLEHIRNGYFIDEESIETSWNAIEIANDFVDYKSYDRNGDGNVSCSELLILVVVAGYDLAFGPPDDPSDQPSVWGHFWGLDEYYEDNGYILEVDGVALLSIRHGGGYVQVGELHGDHMATIGVICHELCHALGLPDLYDFYRNTSMGLGQISLMAAGAWNGRDGANDGQSPSSLDPWSKFKMGWIEPVQVIEGRYIMYDSSSDRYNVLQLFLNESNPKEYFLVANRQPKGMDEALLHNHIVSGGIEIYHVDETMWNTSNPSIPNINKELRVVDLEEADEGLYGQGPFDDLNLWNRVDSDCFYRIGGVSEFTTETVPNSNSNDGERSGIEIRVLSESSERMEIIISRT